MHCSFFRAKWHDLIVAVKVTLDQSQFQQFHDELEHLSRYVSTSTSRDKIIKILKYYRSTR